MDKVNLSNFELSASLGGFLEKKNTVNQHVKKLCILAWIFWKHMKMCLAFDVTYLFDTRKNTQRLNSYQECHQKKEDVYRSIKYRLKRENFR
jgi:hypothetical protein